MDKSERQGGDSHIEITPAMIVAGVAELYRVVPMDIARPLVCDEDIVERIFTAMSLRMYPPADRAACKALDASESGQFGR